MLDEKIILLLNGNHTPWMDAVMLFVTNRFVWIPFYLLLVVFLVKKYGWKQGLIWTAAAGAAVGLSDWFCASVIRPEVARLRPCSPDNPFSQFITIIGGQRPRSFSFPSCHAANSVALATIMALVVRRRWFTLTMGIWALALCTSRAYLAVHYPSDLLVGALIGALFACLIYIGVKAGLRRWPISAAALLFAPMALQAQKPNPEWGGEFATVFDNREGDSKLTPARTFFLTRLSPEVGLSIDHGRHRVMGGAVWLQPIATPWREGSLSPTLYYRYRSRKVGGYMGMFPRTALLRQLPEYLVSDSTRYVQHNLRGAMIQVHSRHGFFEALCDWRGMQSASRREAFAIIAQGEWRHGIVRLGGTAMLNHLANTKPVMEGQNVVDNMVGNLYTAIDFSPLLCPCSRWHNIRIEAGPIGSLSRDRNDRQWLSTIGLRTQINAGFWRFNLRNVTYASARPLFPLFGRFGTQLHEGEPYYSSKFYNRTELSALLTSYRDVVALKAEADFHTTASGFMFYQRLILTLKI